MNLFIYLLLLVVLFISHEDDFSDLKKSTLYIITLIFKITKIVNKIHGLISSTEMELCIIYNLVCKHLVNHIVFEQKNFVQKSGNTITR